MCIYVFTRLHHAIQRFGRHDLIHFVCCMRNKTHIQQYWLGCQLLPVHIAMCSYVQCNYGVIPVQSVLEYYNVCG